MSSNPSSKRCRRRNSRDSSRAKVNLNVDLNSPPVEADASRTLHPPVPPPAAAVEGGGEGPAGALIDLEASDDEIQLLPSPTGFQHVWFHSTLSI